MGVPLAVQNLVETRGGPVPKYETVASQVELSPSGKPGAKDEKAGSNVREPAKVEVEKSAAVSPTSPTTRNEEDK
ncbi:hypothetical protein BCR44DRAFT_34191 [Catenaria anguillulae PL171]|uniref:Uncharacterized protein n=1 Tax=Catenaria anguillulae PL171 TaxID=765915 RepID=A0A1Y2HL97_9FUNG|nr:hypothetical protein BCR44DRAFT_34191 [Catenaria anguillulae PL171]